MADDKKTLFVDGREVEFTNERNLLEVIRNAGIEVPTFCYREDLTTFGACRMCVVELEGAGVQASCTMPPAPGMKVHVNTEKTRRVRKISLELLLANHDRDCTTCDRSTDCELQAMAEKYGVREVRFGKKEEFLPIDNSNPSVVRDPNKCILCGACVRACNEHQRKGVLDFSFRGSKSVVSPEFGHDMKDAECIYCGQCVAVCPTAALTIKNDIDKVWKQITNPAKTVVVQMAPAVRVAFGEAFGLEAGEDSTKMITAALRKVGFDKVFDVNFAADLTIMEEGTEFLTRLKEGKNLPIFTSCCPAWVRYAEQKYPELLDNLSTARSPQQMFGAVAKNRLTKAYGISREDLIVTTIMPCTAKKAEAQRPEFSTDGNPDIDYVLTTQELIRMVKEAGVDFENICPEELDDPLGEYTGAGVIFGASGGVAEAAARTAYELATGKTLENVDIKEMRGLDTFKEVEINLEGKVLKVAVINTLAKAEEIIEKVKAGEVQYDFIEVMACPGGCIGGGGQPKSCAAVKKIKTARKDGLYKCDANLKHRKSHENASVKKVYADWLEAPNSHEAHKYLHTHYVNRKTSVTDTVKPDTVTK